MGDGNDGAPRRHAAKAELMGEVGVIALITNGAVAVMLYQFRAGDANMRSAWICSRNDAIGNVVVLPAAVCKGAPDGRT
jgi:Co/Zn/Cd efflux system component